MRWKGRPLGWFAASQVRTRTPVPDDATVIDAPGGGSSGEPPATFARVAAYAQAATEGPKEMTRPLMPCGVELIPREVGMPAASTIAWNVTPLGPGGPAGPREPRRDSRVAGEMSVRRMPWFLMSRVDTAPVLSSDGPTDRGRNCLDPTLLRGTVKAYDVPPSAMNTAKVDITFP